MEEIEYTEQLMNLLQSGETHNIELAIQLITGLEIKVTQDMVDAIHVPLVEDTDATNKVTIITGVAGLAYWRKLGLLKQKPCPIMTEYKRRLQKIKANQEKFESKKKHKSKYWNHGR